MIERIETDVLVLGAGGAGLCAALHAADASPRLDVTVVVKGLLGRAGCTRMVQGGYNAVLTEPDSLEAHLLDTLKGGGWINDQELAWTLVTESPKRVLELEWRYGCAFDRHADGRIHQKPFAGQTHDRTIHKGDLTGIEIMNRLTEQAHARVNVRALEECRAVELLLDDAGRAAGALVLEMRTGRFVAVHAGATLLAMGGGPTMYRVFACSADKSSDGIALAWAAGVPLRDMEMIQFHPTGLVIPGSLMTGALLEEGLRGAGGFLLNGAKQRFMPQYDPLAERATRDFVSRAMYSEMRKGHTTPHGGLYISMAHLGAEKVRRDFKGMVERCADCGFDLAGGLVEVVPTAHYMMGGVEFAADCSTALPGLFVAGEDSGGVHGANRLGGNGVANSTVFGAVAGDTMAQWVQGRGMHAADESVIAAAVDACERPFRNRAPANLEALREKLYDTMWHKVGIIRDAAGLDQARAELAALDAELDTGGLADGQRAFNLTWHDWLNLKSLVSVSGAIAAAAAARRDSRGAHFRADFPEPGALEESAFTSLRMIEGTLSVSTKPVSFTRVRPGETLLKNAA